MSQREFVVDGADDNGNYQQERMKAIVLHTLKYGDSSVIADLFTEDRGRVAFIVRIPKTGKARVKKQFFQPMTILDIEYDFRQRSTLQHLRDARLAVPYVSIPFDPVKLSLSLFLAEFLYYATRDEQQNLPLLNYVEHSMQWLDTADRSFANFHLVFMMRFSRFIGFYPNVEAPSNLPQLGEAPASERGDNGDGKGGATLFFDLREAAFVAIEPLHPDFLRPDDAAHVQTLMRMNYETMHLFRLSRVERNQIASALLRYYRLHIPQMPELQSFAVLQELFV